MEGEEEGGREEATRTWEYFHNFWFKSLGGASVKKCGVINRARVWRLPTKFTHPLMPSPGSGVWLWKWSLRVAWEGSHVSTTENSIPAGQALVERNLWLRELWHQPAGPWRVQPAHSQVRLLLCRPALLTGLPLVSPDWSNTEVVALGRTPTPPQCLRCCCVIKNFPGFLLPTLSPGHFVLLSYVFWGGRKEKDTGFKERLGFEHSLPCTDF